MEFYCFKYSSSENKISQQKLYITLILFRNFFRDIIQMIRNQLHYTIILVKVHARVIHTGQIITINDQLEDFIQENKLY